MGTVVKVLSPVVLLYIIADLLSSVFNTCFKLVLQSKAVVVLFLVFCHVFV